MICQDAPRARCYLEVNTAAIANNLAAARELLKPKTRLIAVLKADAYGYGLRTVGRFLWTQGVRHFAVACLSEAFEPGFCAWANRWMVRWIRRSGRISV